jgi:uncharacterized membrane protein YdcZ (DUF606 family)
MRQPTTIAQRMVEIAGMVATVVWCVLALWVILSYQGSTAASTWTARLVMMLLAAAVTAGVVLAVRRGWRRGLASSLPDGRLNRWIARRPGWQLALFYWLLLGLPPLAANVWSAHSEHHAPSAGLLGIVLVTSVLGASFLALMLRVVWRRQAQAITAPPASSQDD